MHWREGLLQGGTTGRIFRYVQRGELFQIYNDDIMKVENLNCNNILQ